MQNLVSKFTPAVEADKDDAGLTTVEYAVAAAVVVLGAGAAFALLGPAVSDQIELLVDAVG